MAFKSGARVFFDGAFNTTAFLGIGIFSGCGLRGYIEMKMGSNRTLTAKEMAVEYAFASVATIAMIPAAIVGLEPTPSAYTRRVRWIAAPLGFAMAMNAWKEIPVGNQVVLDSAGNRASVRVAIPIMGPYYTPSGRLNVTSVNIRTVVPDAFTRHDDAKLRVTVNGEIDI